MVWKKSGLEKRREDSKPPISPPEKKITFTAWLDEVRAKGEKPITTYEPVWETSKTLGVPDDWIEIAWLRFVDRYTKDPQAKRKKYIDWRRVFLNAITDNWLGLWYFKDGAAHLTTAGVQADMLTRESA